MAAQQLGRDTEAQEWFGKAQEWMHEFLPPTTNPGSAYQFSWQRRADIEILRAEAAGLLSKGMPDRGRL
jgi:hypothetical protein